MRDLDHTVDGRGGAATPSRPKLDFLRADGEPLDVAISFTAERIQAGADRLGVGAEKALAALARASDAKTDFTGDDAAQAEKLAHAIVEADAARIDGRPDGPDAWAGIALTPANGALRERLLRRVFGKLLHDGLDPLFALALVLALNTAQCKPPLAAIEVERLCRWVAARHNERRGA